MTAALGESLPHSHLLRQTSVLYQNASGIETGYGFFAPSVPNSFKLVFEIHYPDGQVEYDLPHVSDPTAGECLTGVLDQIGRMPDEPVREIMLKMLAYSAWQEHSDASVIRTVLGFIVVPTPAEVRRGQKERYQFIYAYDFNFSGGHPRGEAR